MNGHKLLSFLLKLTLIIWIIAAAAILWFGPVEAAPPPKVTICHVLIDPPQTIEVPAKAVSAHLAHGDYLGPCVEPTPTPSPTPTETPTQEPTPPPTATPEPPEPRSRPATGLLWLLTNGNQHCLIFSDVGFPSIERQGRLCWPEFFDGSWVATNAPCAGVVYSRWLGDTEGFWLCDSKTRWRLPLAELHPIYAKHAARDDQ